MKPTAIALIAACLGPGLAAISGARAFEATPTTQPELRFRFHASATHPSAADAMAPDALLAVQWSIPPEFFAVRLADGPVLALNLAFDRSRNHPGTGIVAHDPEPELPPGRLSQTSAPGLYTIELSLRPPVEDQPAALSGPAAVPAPAAWIVLPLATVATRRRR